jgi:hypothetical protein
MLFVFEHAVHIFFAVNLQKKTLSRSKSTPVINIGAIHMALLAIIVFGPHPIHYISCLQSSFLEPTG